MLFGVESTDVGALSPPGIGEDLFFERIGNAWLLAGSKRICTLSFVSGVSGSSSYPFGAVAFCRKGLIGSANVTGGSIWNSTTLAKQLTAVSFFYSPSPGINIQIDLDSFSTPIVILANPLAAGTPFTFQATPVSGIAVNSVVLRPADTTETVTITSPATTSLKGIAPDQPIQMAWSRPTTFQARSVSVSVSAFPCRGGPRILLGDATTATVTIPSTCNGLPITSASLGVTVFGVDGELSSTTLILN